MPKQSTPVKEVILGPIGPEDPICPYFDREKKVCVSPNCPRLHCPCQFWDSDNKKRIRR